MPNGKGARLAPAGPSKYSLTKPKERKHGNNDNHKTDDVNDVVHDFILPYETVALPGNASVTFKEAAGSSAYGCSSSFWTRQFSSSAT